MIHRALDKLAEDPRPHSLLAGSTASVSGAGAEEADINCNKLHELDNFAVLATPPWSALEDHMRGQLVTMVCIAENYESTSIVCMQKQLDFNFID